MRAKWKLTASICSGARESSEGYVRRLSIGMPEATLGVIITTGGRSSKPDVCVDDPAHLLGPSPLPGAPWRATRLGRLAPLVDSDEGERLHAGEVLYRVLDLLLDAQQILAHVLCEMRVRLARII
jgi:hypothetical protein